MPFDSIQGDTVFECQMCGDCCKGYGGTYVSEADIKRIAEFIKIDADRFVDRYCEFSGGKPLLAQADNGYCLFWDPIKMCTIHPVKPKMCRAWPFIESVLVDRNNWLMMARCCPGMRTDLPWQQILKVVEDKCRES